MKILLIEDTETQQVMFKRLCFKVDPSYEIDIASEAPDGIELAVKNDYDLIVSDFNLEPTGFTAINVIREVRKSDKITPIVVITAYASFDKAVECLNYGADDFYNKEELNESTVKQMVSKAVIKLKENSERERIKELFVKNSTENRILIENVDASVFSFDMNRKLVRYNQKAKEFFLRSMDVTLKHGINARSILPETITKSWIKILNEALEGKSDLQELFFTTVNGEDCWIEVSMSPIDIHGEIIGAAGFAREVTGRKKDEFLIKQTLEKEVEINQIKSRFITTAAHQFRTPLTIIYSNVELMHLQSKRQLNNPVIEEEITGYKRKIEKEIDHLTELINGVLQNEKVIVDTNLKIKSNDLTQTCQDIVDNFNMIKPGNRSLNYEVIGKVVPLKYDEELLSNVLYNLVDNAFKYSEKHNPELLVKYEPTGVNIQVKDQGIGIPKKDLEGLFTPFFRASNAKKVKGTGLGLSIVKEYLERNNGTIEVDSIQDVGTTFTIRIPTSP